MKFCGKTDVADVDLASDKLGTRALIHLVAVTFSGADVNRTPGNRRNTRPAVRTDIIGLEAPNSHPNVQTDRPRSVKPIPMSGQIVYIGKLAY